MIVSIEKWKSALLSTLFISTLPNVLLYLIPMSWLKSTKSSALNIQHILLCFAAGGLLGDVLLHSIPHLLSPHKHENADASRILGDQHEEHDHHHHNDEHEHEHDHEHKYEYGILHNDHDHDHHHHEEIHLTSENSAEIHDHHHQYEEHNHDHLLHIGLLIALGYLIFFVSERLLTQQFSNDSEKKKKDDSKHSNHSHSHSHSHSHQSQSLTSNISVMGWLNIFADVMHNFTDGIAMGASYASGNSSTSSALGLAATISILFHEIPHEIGDFTVLIESGVSKSQAIRMQFYTSIAAFLGTIFGLMSEGLGVWNEILLAVTSGGFIYVATSSLIPTVLNKTSDNTPSSRYTQIFLECLGLVLGIFTMYIVGLFE